MGSQEYKITNNTLFSIVTIFLMICLVAQANIPLPVLALPLYILTKILDVSRLRRALLAVMKGIISLVPFSIPSTTGQIGTKFQAHFPGVTCTLFW